jgi:hypothetical protein
MTRRLLIRRSGSKRRWTNVRQDQLAAHALYVGRNIRTWRRNPCPRVPSWECISLILYSGVYPLETDLLVGSIV